MKLGSSSGHSVQNLGLSGLALIVLFTMIAGIIFARFKQPPMLGYILCGLLLGPAGLGHIENPEFVGFLSDLGIVFLMFVIGFELRLAYFKDIWKLAVGTTLAQILVGLLLCSILGFFWSWPLEYIFLIGFSVALSSTSAVVKLLEALGQTQSDNGQRAIAILIAQDLAIVPMIIVLQNLHTGYFSLMVLFKLLLSFGLIVGLIALLSAKNVISLPFSRIVFKDKELVTLMAFALCIAAACVTSRLGLSEAFGAFLVGLFLGNTEQQKLMIDTIRPIQTILVMVFFFSMGLKIDPSFVWQQMSTFTILLLTVTIGKSFINVMVLRWFNLPWSDAFYTGILLAQIGEFSFLISKMAKDMQMITSTEEGQLISLTILSLSFTPIWLKIAKRMKVLANVNVVDVRTLMSLALGNRFGVFFYTIFYYMGPFWRDKFNKKNSD